jgi:hypothetical protein
VTGSGRKVVTEVEVINVAMTESQCKTRAAARSKRRVQSGGRLRMPAATDELRWRCSTRVVLEDCGGLQEAGALVNGMRVYTHARAYTRDPHHLAESHLANSHFRGERAACGVRNCPTTAHIHVILTVSCTKQSVQRASCIRHSADLHPAPTLSG